VIALLDVNVLIALAWPSHVHHQAAHAWFRARQADGWATCPVTQSGFVRVSSNPRVFQPARTPAEALALLVDITRLPGHCFWTDSTKLCRSTHLDSTRIVDYRQVTDAHLLAIALDHDGRLATFDRAIAGLAPPSLRDRLTILSG